MRHVKVRDMTIGCCWLYVITKYGYPPSVDDTIKAVREMADMGFHAIELEAVGRDNLKALEKKKRDLKDLCERRDLKVVNLVPVFFDLVNPRASLRNRAFTYFRRGAELAVFFGSPLVQIDSYYPPIRFKGDIPYKEAVSFGKPFQVEVDPRFRWERFWAVFVDVVKRCNRIAEDLGLKLCLEPRVGETVSNTDAVLRLMQEVGSENFGAVLDTGHLHAQKEILPLSVEKLGKKVFHVHVSDNNGRDNFHLGLGKGTIDWDGTISALRKVKFDGCIGIDVGNVPDIEQEILRSKAFLERLMKKI